MTRSSELIVHGVEDIGFHYAETLQRWRDASWPTGDEVLRLGYDEEFIRTWDSTSRSARRASAPGRCTTTSWC